VQAHKAGSLQALIARVQADDHIAFAELYDRHVDGALRIARSICRDNRMAEDAVQEGFLAVWRNRSSYQPGRGSVQGWTMMIIRSKAIDSYRRSAARPHEQSAHIDEETLSGASVNPSEAVIARSERDSLKASVHRLPAAQAEVIRLGFFGGLSHSEIASQLGLPSGTVKGRMRLGLEKLRGQMQEGEVQRAA
jgi:RNA polymerase sigma-70 factor (ECF subfamily)